MDGIDFMDVADLMDSIDFMDLKEHHCVWENIGNKMQQTENKVKQTNPTANRNSKPRSKAKPPTKTRIQKQDQKPQATKTTKPKTFCRRHTSVGLAGLRGLKPPERRWASFPGPQKDLRHCRYVVLLTKGWKK